MRIRRNTNLLIEPPQSAASDIAFILIVFFLVCASVQPDSGRPQEIPRAESKQQKKEQSQNIEVALTRATTTINGNPVSLTDFETRLRAMLAAKTRPEDRIVVVKSDKNTPYQHWIQVTGHIDQAGGIVTLQLEEERTVTVD